MITVEDKTKCCGCAACKNICPQKCIQMVADNEGFFYPYVDHERCVGCNLCDKVCPMQNQEEKIDIKAAFVLCSKDEKIRKEGSSGGFFTALAEYVINSGGVVYGVAYRDRQIKHVRITSNSDIGELRGSKYVQSKILDIYDSIAEDLKKGSLVCFSGTSCQLNGILNYLNLKKISTENFISLDLICHGVSSPLLWEKYIDYQEKKHKSKVVYINFRYKTYGYHSGSMKLGFENGKSYYGSGRVDYMLKSFFSEISSRPSCYKCNFKEFNRKADFTVFDAWNYSKLTGDRDDDQGYTNVLVNTDKGKKLFDQIKDSYRYTEVDANKAIHLDGIMYDKSAIPHPKRNEFYINTADDTMDVIAKKYLNITLMDRFIEKLKMIYYYNKRIK